MPRRETEGDDGFRGVDGLGEEVGGERVCAEGVEHEYRDEGGERWGNRLSIIMMIGDFDWFYDSPL